MKMNEVLVKTQILGHKMS